MQENVEKVQELDHQEAVQHLWANWDLGGWRAPGASGGFHGPPGRRHPTSSTTSPIYVISPMSTSGTLK